MYTANFNKNNADLKVRSSDGVDFDLHLAVLSVNAGSFPLTASRGVNPNNATTTSSGSGSSNNASTSTSSSSTSVNATSTSTGPEVIHLSERAEVLRICFEFVYPKRHPDLEDLKEFKIVADIANAVSKYGIFAGVNTCNTRLRKFLPTNAMDIFLYAIKYDYTKLTNEAIPYFARSPHIDLLKKLPSNYTIPWVEYHDAWSTPFKNAIKRIKAIPSCSVANQCHPSTVSSNPTPHTLRVSTNFLGICTACRCAALVWVSNLEELGTIEEVKSAVDSVIMLGSFGVGVGLGASGHGFGVSNLCCGATSSSAVGFSSSGQSPFAQFFAAPAPAMTTGPITTTAIAPRVTPPTTTTTTTTNTGPTSGTAPSSSTTDSPGLSKLPFGFPTANATASTSTTTAPQATSSGVPSFGGQATAPFAPNTTGFGTTPFWVKPAAQAPSPPSSSSAAPAPASAPAPAPTPVATTGIILFGQKVSAPSVSTSAFGASSSFGAPASTPAPAAPSASTTGSVFGTFGTTSTSTSTSTSTTAPAPTPTTLFGSPFGAKAPAASSTTPTTGFGASSSSTSTAPATAPSAATSAFSSNSSFGAKATTSSSTPTTGFGASASSAAAAAAASAPTSGFGATSSFGAKPPAASSTPATGFGASSSFGAASAGAAPSAPTSGFGATSSFGAKPPAASSTPATSSSFGAASAGAAPSATTSGFGSSSFAAPAPAPAAPSPPSTTGPSESSLVLKTTNTKPSTAHENLRLMTTTTPSSSQPVCGHLMQVAKLLKEDIDAVPSFDTFFKANGGGVGGDNGDDAVDVVGEPTGVASATPGGRAHKSGVVRRVRPGNWL